MFGSYYSKQAEAVQCRKSAKSYYHAYRNTIDAGLRKVYRNMFIAEMRLARALANS